MTISAGRGRSEYAVFHKYLHRTQTICYFAPYFIGIYSLVEKYCMQHAGYHLTACMLSETCMSQSCRSHVLHMD